MEELYRPLRDSKGRFDNPWPWKETTFYDILKRVFSQDHATWGKAWLKDNETPTALDWQKAFPCHKPDLHTLSSPQDGTVQATWIGHASLLVQMAGVTFLTDPVFSQRCSPVQFLGPKRLVQPPFLLTDADLPTIDFVLISHDHYDHLDSGSVKQLHKRFGSSIQWYVPLKLGRWLCGAGIPQQCIHEMDWWQEESHLGGKLSITMVPAQHWSKRNPLSQRETLWGGYVVRGQGLSFYFAGDTAYCPAFKQIGRVLGPFDLAAIPIGAYLPRNVFQHMHCDPAQAVQIHKDLRSLRSVGIHCCTLHMTSQEAMDEPPSLLREESSKAGLKAEEFTVIQHGATLITAGGRDYNVPDSL